MLFLNTVVGPGHDGTLLRVKGTSKALAGTTDGNGRHCYLDPRRGAARLVYESALNVAVTGARPLGVVDNLNFGNPEKPEVMWQFSETIDGIAEACENLRIPVLGGNVSFYNETEGIDIYPTPIVGLIGLADPYPESPPRLDRAATGMDLWLLGPDVSEDLAGSAYQKLVRGTIAGRPSEPDADMAGRVVVLATRLASEEITPVLHDLSEGGLALAVAKVCIISGVGVTIDWPGHPFAEDPHRLIAGLQPGQSDRLVAWAAEAGVPVRRIGTFGGNEIRLGPAAVTVDQATEVWRSALPRRMG
jgi:phosphoribosylformylglycinamidine synthase